jgi:hypothetical protein
MLFILCILNKKKMDTLFMYVNWNVSSNAIIRVWDRISIIF